MEYDDLLTKGATEKDSHKRMLYVAAWAVSQYKCTLMRVNKPFNPILGETFELKTKNFLYFAEQISHHPPISAAYCTST